MSVSAAKMSFLIEDLLRDTHGRKKIPADTPAVITTGFPIYCFPPNNLNQCQSTPHSPREDSSPKESNSPGNSDSESSKDSSDSNLVRSRPSFSAHQVDTLKSIFAHKQYLGKEERRNLAADLNMTDEQVKTWFQNKRTKLKKNMYAQVDEHYAKMLYLRDLVSNMPPEHKREFGFHGYHAEYPGVGVPIPSPDRTVPPSLPYYSY